MLTQANTIHDANVCPETGPTAAATLPKTTEMDALCSEKNIEEDRPGMPTDNGSEGSIEKPTGLALCILLTAVFSSAFIMALNGSMVATVRC